eukprot:879435-Prorocentrum_minimum.AAC.5
MEAALSQVKFTPRHLWDGYKHYYLGSYYKDEAARARFGKTRLAAALRFVYEQPAQLVWRAKLER